MQIRPVRSLRLHIKALCGLFGEKTNEIVRLAAERLDVDKNAIAATLGALLGLFDGQKVPRKIECIDLVKALGIERDYDEQRVYGTPSIEAFSAWERGFMPTIDELFSKAGSAIGKLAMSLVEDLDEGIKMVLENYEANPLVIEYDVLVESDVVRIRICYNDPSIAESVEKLSYGGVNSALLANFIALREGFKGARRLENKRVSESCVELRYGLIKR